MLFLSPVYAFVILLFKNFSSDSNFCNIITRLVLMGDEDRLQKMVGDIMSSLGGSSPFKVVDLNMEEEHESFFDEAVELAWKLLGSLDAFVSCYSYEGNLTKVLLWVDKNHIH